MALDNFSEQYPNNPDITSEINKATIMQTTPQGFEEDPYAKQLIDAKNASLTPQAIGPQGAALYPGLRHNINVGTQSGSIIGSQGVYVPGGNIMAVDPVLARRKALDDAARARAASVAPIKPFQPYKLKDADFQKKYERHAFNRVNEITSDAIKRYGKDAGLILENPSTQLGREYIQELANLETMGREFDQITDQIAAIDEGLETGELSYSDSTLKAYDEYKNLVGSFEGGDPFKSQDLRTKMGQLDGFLNLEYYIQQGSFLDDIMGRQTGYSYNKDEGGFFENTTGETVNYDKAIEEVADSLINKSTGPFSRHVSQGFMTRDDVVKTLKSRFKKQTKVKKSLQQKSAATRAGETEEIIAGEKGINRYNENAPGSGKSYKYDSSGKRIGEYTVNPLIDIQMSIRGKSEDIYERDPESGKFNKVSFRGIPLNNVKLMTSKDDFEEVPGIVRAELQEVSKLDDGTIVQKARVAVPTGQKVTDSDYNELEFDSYSFEDRYIILEDSNGQGTGAMTEIKIKGLSSDEARKNYDNMIGEARAWRGDSKYNKSYVIDGESYTYDELSGAGWSDDEIKSLKN